LQATRFIFILYTKSKIDWLMSVPVGSQLMRLNLVLFISIVSQTYSQLTLAQCPITPAITISGDTCVGSILTAVSNVQGATVIWKKDGTTVATQVASITAGGITVAGGNGAGFNANQLNNPNRIYLDASGTLYIPDMSNSRIQKWPLGTTSGITVAGGNGVGSAANQFNRPTSVALDSDGNIYVSDQTNGRIQKWTPGATTGITVVQGLSYPTGIFIDAQNNIYVSEQFASMVTKWAPGASTGTIAAGGNGYGSAANQLSTPTGIFLDPAGNVYICDTDNNRIQKWAPGATSGTTVAGGNGFGSGANQLANPLGIYVHGSGDIYISDFNNYRVQKWTPGATSGNTVAGGNGPGSGANQLNQPAGIYMDAACNLFVSDFYNHRVQKFSANATNTYTTLSPGVYTATLVTSSGVAVSSNSITVVAPRTPAITIQASATIICEGNAVTFTAMATYPGPSPLFQWKKNGVNVGSNSNIYIDNNIVDGDIITCLLTSNAVCLMTIQAQSNPIVMEIQTAPAPVNLGPDIVICPGEQLVLTAGAGYSSYLWQDGSGNSSFVVVDKGTYHVKAQDACGNSDSDTILVRHHQKPENFLPDSAKLCPGATVELKPSTSYRNYLWSTTDTTESIEISLEGTYWLQVVDQNNCRGIDTVLARKEGCIKKLYVPSGFTPNNDGRNDLLKPIFFDEADLIRFDIYNRWGQLIFHSTEIDKGWDGRLKGIVQSSGTFVWVCTFQFKGEPVKTEKGVVTLIR